MPGKKKKEEKKYMLERILMCEKCETISECLGPCDKCGNIYFKSLFKMKQIN